MTSRPRKGMRNGRPRGLVAAFGPVMNDAPPQPTALPRGGTAPPLAVDLEALLASDPLWERVIQLLRRRPWLLLALPFWALLGRARLEQAVAKRVPHDAAHLPYRRELLDFLREAAG